MMPNKLKFSTIALLAGVTAAVVTVSSANAQSGQDDDDGERFLIAGITAEYEPVFLGSKKNEVEPQIYVNARWGRFFAGQRGVGLDLFTYDGDLEFALGTAISLGEGRVEGDDIKLKGLGSIDRPIEATLFGELDFGFAEAGLTVGRDIGKAHKGTFVDLDVSKDFELNDRLELEIEAKARWADKKFNQVFYGVNALQATRSGYRAYTPKAGMQTAAFSVGLTYKVTDRWFVRAEAESKNLLGDSKKSPFIAKQNGTAFGIGIARRF
jgi:outer membrane protein